MNLVCILFIYKTALWTKAVGAAQPELTTTQIKSVFVLLKFQSGRTNKFANGYTTQKTSQFVKNYELQLSNMIRQLAYKTLHVVKHPIVCIF